MIPALKSDAINEPIKTYGAVLCRLLVMYFLKL